MSSFLELPLFTEPVHEYTFSIENQVFVFTFRWITRTSDWYFDIKLEDLTPIVLNQKLVPYYPILADYDLSSFGLTGYLFLTDTGDFKSNKLSYSPESLYNYYRLFYVYET